MEGQVDKIAFPKKEIKSQSLNAKAWKRLKRNRSAMFGLLIIILSVVLALFAYALAPDNSPSANEQMLQIATHPPGFSIEILKLKRDGVTPTGLFSGLIGGFAKDYEPVPITTYKFSNDSLLYAEYKGKAYKAEIETIALSSCASNSKKRRKKLMDIWLIIFVGQAI